MRALAAILLALTMGWTGSLAWGQSRGVFGDVRAADAQMVERLRLRLSSYALLGGIDSHSVGWPRPSDERLSGGQAGRGADVAQFGVAPVDRKPGDVFSNCDGCPEMVVVPPGAFMMGSPADEAERMANEGPQHRVTIAGQFAIGKYEVTFEQWDTCVADGGCDHRPDDEGWGRGRRPVIYVNMPDVRQYTDWLSQRTGETYRLPSEAEWEYATRAGTTTPFHFGSTISPVQANFNGSYVYGGGAIGVDRQQSVPVGSFPANGFGLHDMHGNVWEWVEDCSSPTYDGAPVDGTAWLTAGCEMHVIRSGSSHYGPGLLRSANRIGVSPDHRVLYYGFRVAMTLP